MKANKKIISYQTVLDLYHCRFLKAEKSALKAGSIMLYRGRWVVFTDTVAHFLFIQEKSKNSFTCYKGKKTNPYENWDFAKIKYIYCFFTGVPEISLLHWVSTPEEEAIWSQPAITLLG